jgi:hypothetical protein
MTTTKKIKAEILRIETIQLERQQHINAGYTDYDDCWRTIKSENAQLSILRANLRLAEADGFAISIDVETDIYTHPDFKTEGIIRDGQYGQYVMFKDGEGYSDNVLFSGLSQKTLKKNGVKKNIIVSKIDTFQEYILGYNTNSLTGMGYSKLVYLEICSDDDAEQMKWYNI